MTTTGLRGRLRRLVAGFATIGLALAGLSTAAQHDADAGYRPDLPAGLDLYMPVPVTNPLRPATVALGRRLFFDPILSRDGTVSCATCHDPRRAFTDGLPRAVGVDGRAGQRHAPTLINRGYGRAFFWDGRAETLEDQALQPIENPDEFASSIPEAMARLRARPDYQADFQSAFERDAHPDDLARALASYVRTILSGDSPADRFVAGDTGALDAEEVAGLRLFQGRANCTACHFGPTLSDERFHNTGVAFRDETLGDFDQGRAAVTGEAADLGRFKTPTLRDVARTAPYMHDGGLETLEDVVDFYSRGGRANPNLDSEIRSVNLTNTERRALVAYLGALTGTVSEGRLVAR